MDKTSNKYLTVCIYLALALTTLAVFWQLRNYDFVSYDDWIYVSENPHVKAGLTRESIVWAFTPSKQAANWHPVTWLSHMLDVQFHGTDPGFHHMTNLLLHIANTLLLFAILKRMTAALWPSAFVAAAFALHPLHVESVAWIAERKDVLSTLFWFLTMGAYLRYVKRPGKVRYLLVLLFFALGLMAKPMLVTLPFVLLLLDFWPLGRFEFGKAGENFNRRSFYRLIWEKVPFFVLSAISSVITFLVQRSGDSVVAIRTLSLDYRIANAFFSYLRYIGKMLWPARLAVFYPHLGENLAMWQAAVSAVLLIAVSVWVIRLAPKHKYLPVGWFWYAGALVPVIGLVQVGEQAMADRYSYIPLIGLFIIIAWGLPQLLAKWRYRKAALGVSAPMVLLALAVCSWFQAGHWRSSETLFEHALNVTDDNYLASCHLAEHLRRAGKLQQAIAHNSECLRIRPDYVFAHIGLGRALLKTGEVDGAVMHLTKALEQKPDDHNVRCALGIALGRQGKFEQAITQFTEALRIKPGFAEAHSNLGLALVRLGKPDEAIVHLTKALQLDPNLASAHYILAGVLADTGRTGEAIIHFKETLRLGPDRVDAMGSLAWIFATAQEAGLRSPEQAVQLAQRACELTGYQNPRLLDALAAAFAAAGRFPDAIDTAEKALELAASSQDEQLTEQIRQRLLLYRESRPYEE